MKLVCEISVYNRKAPHVKPRSQQSTLAIGYHPPGAEKEPKNLFLIHFTATNKVGQRYSVHRNLEKVFTKFLSDGKATVSLKQPPHDLQIRCNPIQLKAFMHTFKNALEGKIDPTKPGLSTLAVTAVPKKAVPVKSMTITVPSDYPIRGLPKSLTTLNVNGIRKCSLDAQILSLNNLQILNLCDNQIEHLPKRLGDLPLVQLDLSKNQLGNSLLNDWDWADQPRIRSSLKNLNLSDNNLRFFPYKLVKLRRIMVLTMKNNRISYIPFAFRRLKTLRFLNFENNYLASFPNTMRRMDFDTLDISNQTVDPSLSLSFMEATVLRVFVVREPPTLWQIAAKIILSKNIRYAPDDLPLTVIDSLEEYPFCNCGYLCPPIEICRRSCIVPVRVKNLIVSTAHNDILGDSVYCSGYCKYLFEKRYY